MIELRPGLWHWTAPHPEWNPQQRWPREVSSYAIDDGAQLVLIDPQTVPDELLSLVKQRRAVILLTAPWHERDTKSLADDLGATIWTPSADTAQDFLEKFDIPLEQGAAGSDDLRWLRDGDYEYRYYGATDSVPAGGEAYLGRERNDLVLWFPAYRAIISGDSLVDFGQGYGVNPRPRGGSSRDEIVRRLQALLDLPVELVLSAHGAPTDRATLERALG